MSNPSSPELVPSTSASTTDPALKKNANGVLSLSSILDSVENGVGGDDEEGGDNAHDERMEEGDSEQSDGKVEEDEDERVAQAGFCVECEGKCS